MDNSYLAASSAAQGISSLGNAISQSIAAKAQVAYQKQQYQTNAMLASMQAADAKLKGEAQAQAIKQKTDQAIGSERASMGAQGIDVNSGTAAQIQANTREVGAIDALTAQTNAWREAWGYQMQSTGYSAQGNMAQIAGNNVSRNTLLTGGMQSLGYGLSGLYYAKDGSK